jgi:hypothetical protein
MTVDGEPPAWPFEDDPDLGVFVTEEVRRSMPILWVIHHRDGDWVFGGVSDFDEDTTSLVHLSHLAARHPEFADIADLPRGWRAERASPDERWQREERDESDDE